MMMIVVDIAVIPRVKGTYLLIYIQVLALLQGEGQRR